MGKNKKQAGLRRQAGLLQFEHLLKEKKNTKVMGE